MGLATDGDWDVAPTTQHKTDEENTYDTEIQGKSEQRERKVLLGRLLIFAPRRRLVIVHSKTKSLHTHQPRFELADSAYSVHAVRVFCLKVQNRRNLVPARRKGNPA